MLYVVLLFSSIVAAIDMPSAESELSVIGVTFKKAVENHDIDTIMQYVANDGIPCVDGVISRKEVEADFKNQNSWLYAYLFSAKLFEEKYADKYHEIALDKFFRLANNINILADLMVVNGRAKDDWGCVRFESSNMHRVPPVCFFKRDGKWTFTDSPYSCN